ncbi:hypothetical protein AB1Y20_013921 [Prymnesium parvum]|uniref:Peroxin-12 n=1 Tax=Prymnesium parvum TaxID=97485 RepID=A0AB34IGE8_PRYPA
MAYAAALAQRDDGLPSLFELLAQERLMPALRRAHHFVLTVAAQRHPSLFLPLHRRRAALHLGLAALLEAYSLRRHAASFAEHFYGLRREPPPAPSRSLLAWLLLLLPYARASADESLSAAPPAARGARRLARAYRAACAAADAAHLLQLVLHLYGRSAHASFAQRALGYRLRRATAEDARLTRAGKGAEGVLPLLEAPLRHARQLLLLSVLGYRLLEWWHSPEESPLPRVTLFPPPPPPPPLRCGVVVPVEPSRCGVCHRDPVDPAAAPSGLVYCYECIHEAIARDGACPLSGKPATLKEVRRIYETSRPSTMPP